MDLSTADTEELEMASSKHMYRKRDEDEQYKIPITDHCLKLSEENREKIVTSIRKEDCKKLANCLFAQQADRLAALNRLDVPYPASEVFRMWWPLPGSTIWVLDGAFKELNLTESSAILDSARCDYVSVHVALFREGEEPQIPNKKVPGRMPLNDIVRQFAHRYYANEMTKGGSVVIFRLSRRSSEEVTWTSHAKDFKGQQVNIEVEIQKKQSLHPALKNRPDTEKACSTTAKPLVERNVISWIEEDCRLCFEYNGQHMDPDNTTIAVQESGELTPSGNDGVTTRIYERSPYSSRVTTDMAGLSVSSESDNFRDGVFGLTRANSHRSIPGYSQGLLAEDVLRDHLRTDGDYVIQQCQINGVSNLKLSVRHGNQIWHYPVVMHQDQDQETCFSVEGKPLTKPSLVELIKFYRENDLGRPVTVTSGADDEQPADTIYLRRPVSCSSMAHIPAT